MTADDLVFQATIGQVAPLAVAELIAPVRELRNQLGSLVEQLDSATANANGPVSLSWKDVDRLRHQLASVYLLGRSVSRTVENLNDAIAVPSEHFEPVDVGGAVQAAASLVEPQLVEGTTLQVDVASVPAVRSMRGRLILCIAALLHKAIADAVVGQTIDLVTSRDNATVRVAIIYHGSAILSDELVALVAPLGPSNSCKLEADILEDRRARLCLSLAIANAD